MTAEQIFRMAGTSLLLAGFLFLVRRWVGTRGTDRTSRDRRLATALIATALVGAAPGPAVVGIGLDRGTG